ncbi:unnamed protein product [Cuscuta epithymum]|uniref:MATH domain-containing protein n=2 Tax=Cuscuta epithymum TaxID=186058 RepID=A0AAV0DCW3_9ASTE|nr:unnamed protein product [Cuscuta epithymum]
MKREQVSPEAEVDKDAEDRKRKKTKFEQQTTPPMDKRVSKFTWRIKSFSQLDVKKLCSPTFLVKENKWRVVLFPKGLGKNNDHLSMYLKVAGSSRSPNGWSIPANFSIALINQINCNKTIKKESFHTFNAEERVCGFTSFIPLNDLHDKSGGYLVEDTCLIEVEVDVVDDVVLDDVSPSVNYKTFIGRVFGIGSYGNSSSQATYWSQQQLHELIEELVRRRLQTTGLEEKMEALIETRLSAAFDKYFPQIPSMNMGQLSSTSTSQTPSQTLGTNPTQDMGQFSGLDQIPSMPINQPHGGDQFLTPQQCSQGETPPEQ